jgi:hypothetical protein
MAGERPEGVTMKPLCLLAGMLVLLATISAVDPAEAGGLTGETGVKPWAIPDWDYVVGELVVLDYGASDPPTESTSFFYAVAFPPLNKGRPFRGTSEYYDNIIHGSNTLIEIGDQLQVEVGNWILSVTREGVQQLIAMDPDAYWDAATNTIQGSLFPELTSPRVCKVAMYDYWFPPEPGRHYVTVVRLGAFFLEEVRGNDILVRMLSWEESGIRESVEAPASGAVQLSAPYPQPSTGEVTLLLSVDQATVANLKIYDLAGRVVRALGPETFEEGFHSVAWDGTDNNGERVRPGVYFCRIEARGTAQTLKMIVAR